MAYIVDFTLVMERLFWIALRRPPPGTVTKTDLEEGFESYANSGDKLRVHRHICDYVDNTSFYDQLTPKKAHEEVIRLIGLFRSDSVGIKDQGGVL
jgi:hypothetical protein